MIAKKLSIAFAVSLAVLSLPLACGDDQESPSGGDAGSGGSGGEATGGSGATDGGNATGGSSGSTTGGNSGTSTGGRAGTSTGGKAGTSTGGKGTGGTRGTSGGEAGTGGVGGAPDGGVGGTPDGGVGGTPDGGVGGEGGSDPDIARCRRICEKAQVAMCPDMSTCVELFCEFFLNPYPFCRPYADAVLECLDAHATAEDFTCQDVEGWHGPAYNSRPESPCWDPLIAAIDRGC